MFGYMYIRTYTFNVVKELQLKKCWGHFLSGTNIFTVQAYFMSLQAICSIAVYT